MTPLPNQPGNPANPFLIPKVKAAGNDGWDLHQNYYVLEEAVTVENWTPPGAPAPVSFKRRVVDTMFRFPNFKPGGQPLTIGFGTCLDAKSALFPGADLIAFPASEFASKIGGPGGGIAVVGDGVLEKRLTGYVMNDSAFWAKRTRKIDDNPREADPLQFKLNGDGDEHAMKGGVASFDASPDGFSWLPTRTVAAGSGRYEIRGRIYYIQ